MKYRKLGKSGIDVSVIGQGTWGLGNDFFGEVDVEEGIRAIQRSLDIGVNMIDTAAGYGPDHESEYAVAKAIKGRRDKVVLATKLGILRVAGAYVHCLDPDVMRWELESSLKRLETDYIDVYYIHWPDYNFPIEGAVEMLAKFKEEGKIRAIAVSNFSVEQIKAAQSVAQIDAVPPPMNLLNRSSLDNGIVPYCKEQEIGIVTYGSLGGGILTGNLPKPDFGGKELRSSFYGFYDEEGWNKCQNLIAVLREIGNERNASVAEVSINWVLGHEGVTCSLMGATTPAMAEENAAAAEWELTPEEYARIEAAYQKYIIGE